MLLLRSVKCCFVTIELLLIIWPLDTPISCIMKTHVSTYLFLTNLCVIPYSNWYKTCFLIKKYNNYAKIPKYKQILLKYFYISLPCYYRHSTIDMIGSFYLLSPFIKNHDKRMVKRNVNWLTNETIVELAASVCCSLLMFAHKARMRVSIR